MREEIESKKRKRRSGYNGKVKKKGNKEMIRGQQGKRLCVLVCVHFVPKPCCSIHKGQPVWRCTHMYTHKVLKCFFFPIMYKTQQHRLPTREVQTVFSTESLEQTIDSQILRDVNLR